MTMKKYTQAEVAEASLKYFGGDQVAADVFVNKYALRRGADWHELTPLDMHERLAREFARIEQEYPNPYSYDRILEKLSTWEIVPQGSPCSAIGNPFQVQSLSSCFVVASPYDSYGGILYTDEQLAQIMKRRGGAGVDISTIRPKGLPTTNAAVTTDGIEVFMKRFSNTTREVAQGGRRGALMLSLDCNHPQLEDFIAIKKDLKEVTGANISVKWMDDFMKAVEADAEYTLHWPVDVPVDRATVVKTVKAREVFDKFVLTNWQADEPGALFWDTILKMSIGDLYGEKFRTVCTNPCVTGDTIIQTNAGPKRVQELAEEKAVFYTVAYNAETQKTETQVARAFKTRENADLLRVRTKSGKEIKLTPDHRVYTDKGWVEARNLTKQHKILCLK